MRKTTLFAVLSLFAVAGFVSLQTDNQGGSASVSAKSIKPAPQTACVTPPPDMVGWWPGDGNANDIQGGNNGILMGNATATTTGMVDRAFNLNGTTGHVALGNPSALRISGSISIDAWIRPTGLPPANNLSAIMTKWAQDFSVTPNSDSYGLWTLNQGGTLRLFSAIHFNDQSEPNLSGGTIPLNTWSHVAMTWDAATGVYAIYVNGAQVATRVNMGTLVATNRAVAIGKEESPQTRFFPGMIDEVEIFSRAITQAEIQSIFNAGPAGKCKTGNPTPTPTPSPTANPTPTPTPTPPPCAFSLGQTTQEFPPEGGTGQVTVNQTSGAPKCRWGAIIRETSLPFVTLNNGSGSAGDAFTFVVAANSSTFGRETIIEILVFGGPNLLFTVRQPEGGANCTYRLSPASNTVSNEAADERVNVTTTPNTCQWMAVSNEPWILAATGTGIGSAPLGYIVRRHDGADMRTGSITVAGQRHVVNQLGSKSCPANLATSDEDREQFYGFRDKVLSKTARGEAYTEDYYRYAGEITKMMIFNPTLFFRSKEVLERYAPIMRSVLERERGKREGVANSAILEPTIVYDSEIDDVDAILAAFAAESSSQLKGTLEGLRRDIRDPQVQAEFGVRIERGEKRPLPGEERSTIGKLAGFWDIGSKLGILNPFSPPRTVTRAAQQEKVSPPNTPDADDAYGRIPLSFEANRGQVDGRVKYLSRGAGYNLFLTETEAVLSLRAEAAKKAEFKYPELIARLSNPAIESSETPVRTLQMKLDGANKRPRINGRGQVAGKSNYFIGKNSSKWQTGIPNYSRVEYENVYRGIDLVYYGNQRQLEYDFKVAPGADPDTIKMHFEGADKIEVDGAGDLLLHTPGGEARMRAPISYQHIDGVKREVASRYTLDRSSNSRSAKSDSLMVGFELGEYDRSKPLVIDPILVYSTYLGGAGEDFGNGITVDAAGNAYIIGYTDSTNFPVSGALQSIYGGNPQDVFVSKINAAGNGLVYSTYIGGSGQDNGSDIAVDAAGNAYITGYTGSTNFPMANAMQSTRTGLYNAFVAKLNPAGSQLIYSTYYGGNVGEYGSAIAVDADGNAFVGGVTSSANFPDTANAFQRNFGGSLADAFVAKFNPAGSQTSYATLLGGNANDGVTSIAIDSAGNAYVTGVTFSSNFPTASALQTNFRGGAFDAFVTKLNATGTAAVYSTYIGGTDEDRGFRIGVDGASNAYIAGMTQSANFPVAAAVQPTFGGGSDAFVTKLNPAGAIAYSTFLGGSGLDGATGFAVNSVGDVYLTGFTTSTNFPLADASQPSYGGGEFDAFAAKLRAGGASLVYSTYLGGGSYDTGFDVAIAPGGNAYVLGRTASTNFPTVNPLQAANGGAFDVFVTKIAANVTISGRVTSPTGLNLRNANVTLTDSQGIRRTAVTSSFGIYSFQNVRGGENYVLSVSTKRYRFTPRSVLITDSLAGVDFVGLE